MCHGLWEIVYGKQKSKAYMNQIGGTARENEQTLNEQEARLKERGIVFKKPRNHGDGNQAFSVTG